MLKVRPSDPTVRVDVFCDSSPRPAPSPTEHSWWMPAGGTEAIRQAISPRATLPQQVLTPSSTCISGDELEALRVKAGDSTAFAGSKGGIRGEKRQAAAWVTGSTRGGVGLAPGAATEEGWTPLPERRAGETGGVGWSRMTVAMPRDHAGAFHGEATLLLNRILWVDV